MRVGSASRRRISSSRVALLGDDDPGGPAQRGLDRRAEERAAGLVVVLRLGEERRVVHRDRDRAADAQRARVERRVQHLGADLLGEQRQAGLLPGEPGRAVRGGRRRGDDPRGGKLAGVALRVGALAHHRDVGTRLPPGRRAARRRSARHRPGRPGHSWRRLARGVGDRGSRDGSSALVDHPPRWTAEQSSGRTFTSLSRSAQPYARPRTTPTDRGTPIEPMFRAAQSERHLVGRT